MTCSKKVRVLDIPKEDLTDKNKGGEEIMSGKLGICVYLEWFSVANGRVVIESLDFKTELSERTWHMSSEEEESQIEENHCKVVSISSQPFPKTLLNAAE